MKRALRTAVVLAMLVSSSAVFVTAQSPCRPPGMSADLPFSCIPHVLMDALGGSIVSGCADTLQLCMGKPLAAKHADAPVSSPVRLYRLGPDGIHSQDQELLAVHWLLDTARGSVLVIPDPPLPILDPGDPRPIVYRLVTNCSFWTGTESDTSSMDFVKQHVTVVRGTARNTRTNEDITANVIMSPAAMAEIRKVSDGVFLYAEDTDQVIFDHWTTTASGVHLTPDVAEQYVTESCWPLADTVVFTAWYRERTTGVTRASVSDTKLLLQNGSVHITSPNESEPITSIGVTDLHGRLYLLRSYSENTHDVHLPLWGPPGYYLIAVHHDSGFSTHPILVTPH